MARRFKTDSIKLSKELEAPEKKMGGFSDLYKAFCAKFSTPFREDIAWDMDQVLCQNGVTTFDAREFEQPTDTKDLMCLYRTIAHNQHFTTLNVCPLVKGRFDKELAAVVGDVFLTNSGIETLNVFECGPALSFFMPSFCNGLATNKSICLTDIRLAANTLDDKDVTHLAGGIAGLGYGLKRLNLADNQITKKGIVALASGLEKNPHTSGSLEYLNLSKNQIGHDGSSALGSFLANPNNLEELVISDCGANIPMVAAGLSRGSLKVKVVDFSLNKFGKGQNVSDVTAFFSSCAVMWKLNLSGTVPSTEQFKDFLRAITGNTLLENLELNISNNSLGVVGANLISKELKQCFSLRTLICANNGFLDKGMGILCDCLKENGKIVKIDLSDNFDLTNHRRSKVASPLFCETFGDLLSSDSCTIREIKLTSSQKSTQMRGELSSLLLDLGSNKSVVSLDLTGQALEYSGIVVLTKMIQLNKTLKTLIIDENSIDLMCLKSLSHALSRNDSIVEIPTPVADLSVLYAKADASTKKEIYAAWSHIEKTLMANKKKEFNNIVQIQEKIRKLSAELDEKMSPRKLSSNNSNSSKKDKSEAASDGTGKGTLQSLVIVPQASPDLAARKTSLDGVKLSANRTAKSAADVLEIAKATSPRKHMRSKSGGDTRKRVTKSPRAKNLSLVSPIFVPADDRDIVEIVPNPLAGKSSGKKKKRTVRRRPRGPSTRFEIEGEYFFILVFWLLNSNFIVFF
jgi:Ran GTPase-activating protein (RanGAP) involved in mRNA processing and transport